MPSPLAEISSNYQRPRPPVTKPKVVSSRYVQSQDENSSTPSTSNLRDSSPRYLHSTVASNGSQAATHSPLSRLPVRARTPTSVTNRSPKSHNWAGSAVRHVGLRRVKVNNYLTSDATESSNSYKPTQPGGV